MNTLPALLPLARIWETPFDAAEAEPLVCYHPIVGTPLRDWIPPECGRVLLVVNGVALMQAEWVRPVLLGDVIDWTLLPTGGDNKNTSRQVLTIIAIIVIAYFSYGQSLAGGGTLTATQTAVLSISLNLAAQVIINAVIPIKALDVSANSASSVYNVSLSANSARLYQPIPVIYGRMKTFPDFAAQPYAYYVNNNQYYAALFCIGQGEYAVERVQIDDTNIRNFEDVKYRILPPGAAPTLVSPKYVTAPEIAGQELKPGRFTPGFMVCSSGYTVDRIEVDVAMLQGIGYMENDGSITPFPLDMRVDARYVDSFGIPTPSVNGSASWFNVMLPNITGNTRTPQYRTFGANITAGRVEVRMTRTTIGYTDNHYVTTVNWASLRGRVVSTGTLLHPNATHMEVLIKASEQLTGLNQRKINVIVRRKLPIKISAGVTIPPAETRSIAWAIQDIWLNQDYGARQAFNTHDYDMLVTLNAIWAARQDYLDILFDSRTTIREVLKIVSQVGRAVAYQRMGLLTVARDQRQDLPVAGFSGRNIVAGSASTVYVLPTPETADSVVVEYFDNRLWDWVPVTCPAPGVTTPVNPVTIRIAGITQYYQAKREGTYKAADNLWRRKFPKWTTEALGRLPAYGSAVLYAPAMPGWAQSGDVVDATGLSVTLSEPVAFTAGVSNYISFMGPYGKYSAAVLASPGGDPNTVTIASTPIYALVFNDSNKDRTRYIFGPQTQKAMTVRVLSLNYKGQGDTGPLVEMSGVAEDDRVHEADNAYLPVGGVIQSPVPANIAGDLDNPPVGDVPDPGAGGEYYYAIKIGNPRYSSSTEFGGDITATHTFYNTGAQSVSVFDPRPFWMLYGAVEPAIAARYEVRAVIDELVPAGAFLAPAAFNGTWRNLGSTAAFALSLHIPESSLIDGSTITYKALVGRLEIRDVATRTLQDTGNFVLEAFIL